MALSPRVRGALPVVLAASGAGAAVGLAEFLRIHLSGQAPSSLVALAACLTDGAVAAVPALPVGLLLAGSPLGRRTWAGCVTGLSTLALWSLALAWFAGPDPFTRTFPLQGNLAAFGALAAAILAVAAFLGGWIRGARRVGVASAVLVLALGAWVLSAIRLPPERGTARAGSPNILWVTLDTTRADHVGVYGSTVQTPAFDQVARRGVLYESAFAPLAVTGPSHTSMLTATGPWRHGTLLNGIPIPADLPTLPEVLRENGYHTAGFVSSFVLDGSMGYSRGFDSWDSDFNLVKGLGHTLVHRTWTMAWRHVNPDAVVERRGDDTVDLALSWLASRRSQEPWFLWVHLFDAHGPYTPPAPYDALYYKGDPRSPDHTSMQAAGKVAAYLQDSLEGITDADWVVAQYDGEITFADAQLGRLLEAVEKRSPAEQTLVLVNGDHGEGLGEHDLWFDHGANLFDPSTRVPMAIRYPGVFEGGRRVRDPVELLDLTPTLLEVAGIPAPDTMEGRSLVPLTKGQPHREHARGLCFDRDANLKARQEGRVDKPTWRMASLRSPRTLFVAHEAPGLSEEMYDLAADPGQVTNVAATLAADDVGRQLLDILRGITRDLLASMGTDTVERSTVDVGEDTRQRLEALGYME